MTCVRHIRLLPKPRQVHDLIAQGAKNVMTQQLYNGFQLNPSMLFHMQLQGWQNFEIACTNRGKKAIGKTAKREGETFFQCLSLC